MLKSSERMLADRQAESLPRDDVSTVGRCRSQCLAHRVVVEDFQASTWLVAPAVDVDPFGFAFVDP